jgi:hypothetical protein
MCHGHMSTVDRYVLVVMSSRHANAQSDTDSCLLAAITNHILNTIISQVMLINRSRLATCANHASVTHAVYDLTFFHDYKIVSVIQEYIMQTIKMSHGLCLNPVNKPSFISKDVMEIRIK